MVKEQYILSNQADISLGAGAFVSSLTYFNLNSNNKKSDVHDFSIFFYNSNIFLWIN